MKFIDEFEEEFSEFCAFSGRYELRPALGTHNRDKEVCVHGHSLSDAYLTKLGHRICRECDKQRKVMKASKLKSAKNHSAKILAWRGNGVACQK